MSPSTLDLIERLSDVHGAPVIAPPIRFKCGNAPGLYRFRCPVCDGGMGDDSELPFRPLVVASDGRIWCDRALSRGLGPVVCNVTPAKLRAAVERLEMAA